MLGSKSKMVFFSLCLLVVISIGACNSLGDASSAGTYDVDPAFLDFYQGMGGTSILGPAISTAFSKDEISYQYVVAGLIAYDPNLPSLKRFHFSPIASIEWKINSLDEPAPLDPNLPYSNGHRIWEEVTSFYTHYGSDIIGLPVTGVIANDSKQRYEQYFEGLGFYRKYSEPPGQVHLLPYGFWMCGDKCQYRSSDTGPPAPSYSREYSETELMFLQASERFGYGYTGSPLKAPSMSADGNFEMIFENMVLYFDSKGGSQIKLRPLPAWVGIKSDPPTTEQKAEWLSFYATSAGKGYNVPNIFFDYLTEHGGMDFSGAPTNNYQVMTDGGYSQCFVNLCLEYHPTAPEQLRTRPHALGVEYEMSGGTSRTVESTFEKAMQINVSEQNPLIPSGQRQVVYIEVTQDGIPVGGIKLSLVVKQPDGLTKNYQLEPTGELGKTSIELDPINGPNGSIVQYQVCVLNEASQQMCFSRNFTIWDQ